MNQQNKVQNYAFVSPDGKVFRGKSIRKFALERGLDPGNMLHVHWGERSHHKGWKAAHDFCG